MSEEDILNLIREDKWMMDVLRVAEEVGLPDWLIGAGFVRNKVWDHLHGYKKEKADTADIDLAYFDPAGNDEEKDNGLSRELAAKTGLNWEVANQAYTHAWHSDHAAPYRSTADAISKWPETATCIGVTLAHGEPALIAPYGVTDLVNLIVRPSPGFLEEGNARSAVEERVAKKNWLKKWPKLTLEL